MSNDVWSIVVVLGLVGWVGSTILCLFRAFPERNRCDLAAASRWSLGVALFFILWIVGMLNA